jgi:Fic family protein
MEPGLSREEEELILLLAAFPRSSSTDLLQRIRPPISQPTLSRRIEALEGKKIVRREGRARSTVYSLADSTWYVSLPLSRRQAATYRFEWLEGFTPNETRLLSREEEKRLAVAGQVPGVSPNLFFQRVFERFLIDLSYASSKMEGNTYSLLDTERLIKEGTQAEGKAAEETTMILNHKAAILYLVEHLEGIAISASDIKNLHALLSRDLVLEAEPGKLRTNIVSITNSQYSPLAVPQQIEEQFKLIVEKARAIKSPFEQSMFLLISISYLQPFIDVNKRTARLAANIPLFKAGLSPLSYRYMDTARYLGGLLLFYETLNPDGIKAAYLDGYEASAAALKQHYEEHRRQPDRMDIVYRRGIDQAVREIVLYGHDEHARSEILDRWIAGVPGQDQEAVRTKVDAKLKALSPAAAAIYGLRDADVEKYLDAKVAGKSRTKKRR